MLTRAAVGFGAALLLALVVPHAAGRGRFGSEAAVDRPLDVARRLGSLHAAPFFGDLATGRLAARFRAPFFALRTLARGVSDSPEASGSCSAPRVLGMCRNMAASGGGCPHPECRVSQRSQLLALFPAQPPKLGGERPTNRRPRVEQGDERSSFVCDRTRVRIAPGQPSQRHASRLLFDHWPVA